MTEENSKETVQSKEVASQEMEHIPQTSEVILEENTRIPSNLEITLKGHSGLNVIMIEENAEKCQNTKILPQENPEAYQSFEKVPKEELEEKFSECADFIDGGNIDDSPLLANINHEKR